MYCEACGQAKATVHITRTINGETRRMHLCSSCATEGGHLSWASGSNLPVTSLLGGLLDMGTGSAVDRQATGGTACPACGLTYRQFAETGLLGCSTCYETFSAAIEPLLKRIQGETMHRGKRPAGAATEEEDVAKTEEQLRAKLQRAIEEEDYERAAEIRDALRELDGDSNA